MVERISRFYLGVHLILSGVQIKLNEGLDLLKNGSYLGVQIRSYLDPDKIKWRGLDLLKNDSNSRSRDLLHVA